MIEPKYRSFNSQRDGILHFSFAFADAQHRFQFPTGWNSTEIDAEYALYYSVFQFPTGWNSTLGRRKSFTGRTSFNSQRDGILHNSIFNGQGISQVSIPNGMEFYASRRTKSVPLDVSIPNGMEFYRVFSVGRLLLGIVSIPNGMEFYLMSMLYLLFILCFNSQRDGILHILPIVDFMPQLVSIPNGMEFYQAARRGTSVR